ncbi:MAG: PorP/SprF family type IX secretion system membrane protein, partial [Bacteroidia bacterium]|nr:PorP/SprF family type IX secretion system membrane protein [Bacteroidia bacterium]
MKKRFIHIFIFLSLAFLIKAQDIHFSQFTENSPLVNPALTGALSPLKISIHSKDQWRSVTSPYKTIGANIETRFKGNDWQQVEKRSMTFKEKSMSRIAAGLSVYSDRAGDGNFGLMQMNLSLASFVALNKNNSLSLGFQGSFAQRKIDQSKLIFPDQYNGVGYDASQATKETFNSATFNYFDLASGMLWTLSKTEKNVNSNKQFVSHMGFAVFHLTQPKQKFFNAANKLYLKYVVHGDLIASMGKSNIALVPSFLVQLQGTSSEVVAGTLVKHFLNNTTKYTGIQKRHAF